jgi:hypothetical protein
VAGASWSARSRSDAPMTSGVVVAKAMRTADQANHRHGAAAVARDCDQARCQEWWGGRSLFCRSAQQRSQSSQKGAPPELGRSVRAWKPGWPQKTQLDAERMIAMGRDYGRAPGRNLSQTRRTIRSQAQRWPPPTEVTAVSSRLLDPCSGDPARSALRRRSWTGRAPR